MPSAYWLRALFAAAGSRLLRQQRMYGIALYQATQSIHHIPIAPFLLMSYVTDLIMSVAGLWRPQARRVVVLRADVALWASDEVSKHGAALQVSLARRTVAEAQKLKPGDRVRIPHGKRAFASCASSRQQPRAAVPKNSCGQVVSCANGYYTVLLEGESTCKFRRSELQLLM